MDQVSEKELAALNELLSEEELLIKKFKMLSDALRSEIVENGIGSFHDANGGYFLTFYVGAFFKHRSRGKPFKAVAVESAA